MFSQPSFARQPGRRGGGLGGRHHLGIVAAAATLLASAPLLTLFERWSWVSQAVIAVAAVAATAAGARALRLPVVGQVAAMLGALLLALTFLHPSGEEFLLLPTAATLEHFNLLLSEVPEVVATETMPVGNHDGLLLLTALGVGLVAIVVDVLAVSMRRPALAGLPMLAIYSVPVAVSQDSVHGATFIIGVAGYLWLVATDNLDRVRRFGRRFTGSGRDVAPWEPSPLAAAGRRLTVIGLLIAVMLPLAVPGMTTGLIDRFGSGIAGTGGTGQGGTATSVNLFAQLDGLLNRDSTVELLEVTTDDPDPFYLRVGTADEITSQGFDHRQPRGGDAIGRLPGPGIPPAGVTQQRFEASVQVLAWDMNRLPAYQDLTALSGIDGNWRYDPDQQVVFSPDTRASGRDYDLQYVRREFDPEALRAAGRLPDDHEIASQYTEVITEPQVSDLVDELTEGTDNPYEQVRAILAHFSIRNGYRYSLETGSETTGSAIVDFLLVNQAGFCVQYAAAMAWMVREAGLPARVAIGFTRGTERSDGSYLLTNHNLHAWTEVYFDRFGWVPFDPTPSGAVSGSAARQWAPDPNAPPDPNSPAGGPGSGATPLPPGDGPGDGPNALDEGTGGAVGGLPGDDATPWRTWLLIGLAVVVAMLLAPAVRRAQLRRRRLPSRLAQARVAPAVADPSSGVVISGEPAAAARHWAHAAWDELLDTMVDFQVPLDAAETPRSAAERLVRECRLVDSAPAPAAESARLLGAAEERARYALTPGAAGGLLAALRTVRQALASQSSRRTRLRAVLFPPSTLLRWRHATGEAVSQVSLAASRLAEAMAQLSPRRLLRSS
jgi:transglutaminase-like putative cysteine protease